MRTPIFSSQDFKIWHGLHVCFFFCGKKLRIQTKWTQKIKKKLFFPKKEKKKQKKKMNAYSSDQHVVPDFFMAKFFPSLHPKQYAAAWEFILKFRDLITVFLVDPTEEQKKEDAWRASAKKENPNYIFENSSSFNHPQRAHPHNQGQGPSYQHPFSCYSSSSSSSSTGGGRPAHDPQPHPHPHPHPRATTTCGVGTEGKDKVLHTTKKHDSFEKDHAANYSFGYSYHVGRDTSDSSSNEKSDSFSLWKLGQWYFGCIPPEPKVPFHPKKPTSACNI